MKRVGVVGLGDMGSGIAKNLIQKGYETIGFDLCLEKVEAFSAMGGLKAANLSAVANRTSSVFIMVMTG